MTASREEGQDTAVREALNWVIRIHSDRDQAITQVALDQWLARSEEHRAAYRRAYTVWKLTGDLAATRSDIPADETIRGWTGSRRGSRRIASRRWALLVAGTIAAGLLAFVFSDRLRIAIEADYTTAPGEVRRVSLPDGSIADIGADSAIAVDFSTAARQVNLLHGEVYLDVSHVDLRPFKVRTGTITAIAVGTLFDVVAKSQTVDVTVEEGRVQVFTGRPDQPDGRPLTRGQSASIERETGRLAVSPVPLAAIGAWRTGKLVVERQTIRSVIDDIRPYYHGVIILHDQTLAERSVTGIYDLHDPVAALSAAIAPHGGIVTRITPYLLFVSGG